MSARRQSASERRAAEDRIEIAAPDPAWLAAFEREAEALRGALPPDLRATVEHVGSTAVADLAAKPILDLLLIVPDRDRWPELRASAEALGYVFWHTDPNRPFYVKGLPPSGEARTHHLHVRTPADAADEIRFRDMLRQDARLAAGYEALKRHLAALYAADREAYTEGKTAFICAALATRTC